MNSPEGSRTDAALKEWAESELAWMLKHSPESENYIAVLRQWLDAQVGEVAQPVAWHFETVHDDDGKTTGINIMARDKVIANLPSGGFTSEYSFANSICHAHNSSPPDVVQLQGELARLREDAIKQEEEWQEVCRENDKLRDQLAALQGNSP